MWQRWNCRWRRWGSVRVREGSDRARSYEAAAVMKKVKVRGGRSLGWARSEIRPIAFKLRPEQLSTYLLSNWNLFTSAPADLFFPDQQSGHHVRLSAVSDQFFPRSLRFRCLSVRDFLRNTLFPLCRRCGYARNFSVNSMQTVSLSVVCDFVTRVVFCTPYKLCYCFFDLFSEAVN